MRAIAMRIKDCRVSCERRIRVYTAMFRYRRGAPKGEGLGRGFKEQLTHTHIPYNRYAMPLDSRDPFASTLFQERCVATERTATFEPLLRAWRCLGSAPTSS